MEVHGHVYTRRGPNRRRKITAVTLDPEILKMARERGINLSRFLEYHLRKALRVEESHELATNGGNWLLSEGAGTGNFVSRDFEPGSRDPQSRRLTATPSRPPLKIDLFPIYFCFQNLHLLLNDLAEPLSRAKPKPTPDTRNS